jgi:diguanylate cyclase (GGDEF)-like protein/PAS domain S-box-containing protein
MFGTYHKLKPSSPDKAGRNLLARVLRELLSGSDPLADHHGAYRALVPSLAGLEGVDLSFVALCDEESRTIRILSAETKNKALGQALSSLSLTIDPRNSESDPLSGLSSEILHAFLGGHENGRDPLNGSFFPPPEKSPEASGFFPELRHIVAVPIPSSGTSRPRGVMGVAGSGPEFLPEVMGALMSDLEHLLPAFLERNEREQERSLAFRTLLTIERWLHSPNEPERDRVFRMVAEKLAEAYALPLVWVGLVLAGKNVVRTLASAGTAREIPVAGGEQSLLVRAVASGALQVFDDPEADPGPVFPEDLRTGFGVRSGIADSARTREGRTLVLVLYSRRKGPFSPEFLDLASGLAGDLAALYDTLSFESERATLSDYQEAIRSIQQAFLSVRERQELFEIVVRTIETVTDSVAAFIMVCPPGSDALEMVAYSTRDPSLATAISGIHFPLGGEVEGSVRSVAASAYVLRQSVVERPLTGLKALRLYQKIHPEFLKIRSIMATPVFLEGQETPEAVLTVWSLDEDDFTSDLVRLAEELADSLSRALERLQRESEFERLSLIAQKTNDGILMTDAGGRIFWANQAFESKYGFSSDEIRGRLPVDFRTGPDTDAGTLERIREHFGSGRSFEETLVFYSLDRTPFWVRVSATSLCSSSGEPVGYVLVETDVTGLKESEERVRIASLFYRALSESIQTLRSPDVHSPALLLSSLLDHLRSLFGAHRLFLGSVTNEGSGIGRLAYSGPDHGPGGGLNLSDSESPEGRGVVGVALRTETPQIFLKDDPDIPPPVTPQNDPSALPSAPMGGIVASSSRRNGERVLLFGQFPDEFFLSHESAELFQRITVEIGEFLDRKDREALDRKLARYSRARQIISKQLLSATSEEQIYGVLARTLSEETDSLGVDCLAVKGGELTRTALEGPISGFIGVPSSPMLLDSPDRVPVSPPLRAWTRREPVILKNPAANPAMGDIYRDLPFERVRLAAFFPVPGIGENDSPPGVVSLFLENPDTFDNPLLTGLVLDILESASLAIDRFKLHRKMEELSVLDPLTALLNRRGLEMSLHQFLAGIRRNGGLAVIGILDLDDFKVVNDSFGYSAGDALLEELSRRLRKTLRETDLVGRLGGDEFVIVSALSRSEDLEALTDRLSEVLRPTYNISDSRSGEVRMEVSMGVTLYPEDNSDPDGLMRHADEALYSVKKQKSTRTRWWSLWKGPAELPGAADPSPDSSTLLFSDAYGEGARNLIAPVQSALVEGTKYFSDLFYDTLARDPRVGEILKRFSPSDLARLKDRQVRHLRMILAEDLKEEDHRRSARFLGRVHAMVGVSSGGLVEAMRIYLSTLQDALRRTKLTFAERSKLLSLLTYRSGVELEEQVNGMSDLETGRQSLISRLTDPLPHLWNWADFIRLSLKTLVEFDGVTKAALVRPGEGADKFIFEFSSEKNFDSSGNMSGEGEEGEKVWYENANVRFEFESLLERVWQEETMIDVVGTYKDPRLPLSGSYLYERGVKSLVLLPLKNSEDHRFAVLVLASSYPGFFESPFARTFLSGLSSLFSQGWYRFVSREPSKSGNYSHQHLRRLLSDRRVFFHYHPVVDFSYGRASKVELLSFMRSGKEHLSPAHFLPAFGRSELATLFRQGLEAGLEHLLRWEREGCVLDLAINLPPILLFEPGLIRWLSTALLEARVPFSRLHLELLESGELNDTPRQISVLTEIAGTGIHLDMDDLGSGYSSLLRLRSFHFDAVKVDQGLVRGDAGDPERLVALMGSLVKLIQGLGHSAVIEGLESVELVEAARILGADGGQGYAFTRPLPVDEVPDWIRAFVMPRNMESPLSDLGRAAGLWMKRQYGDSRRRESLPEGM